MGDSHCSPSGSSGAERRRKRDLRHEAEAGVNAQSLPCAHIAGVYESFLARGVESGFVKALLLEKDTTIVSIAGEEGSKNELNRQFVAPLKT